MKQKYGLGGHKTRKVEAGPASHPLSPKVSESERIHRSITQKMSTLRNVRIRVENMVGFNVVVRYRGREKFRAISLQDSYELVRLYNFVHLRDYFAARTELVDGEIRFGNKPIHLRQYVQGSRETEYRPFLNLENDLLIIRVELPAYEADYTKKTYFCRNDALVMLSRALQGLPLQLPG